MDIIAKFGTQISPNSGYVNTWDDAYEVKRQYEAHTVSSFSLQKTTTTTSKTLGKY